MDETSSEQGSQVNKHHYRPKTRKCPQSSVLRWDDASDLEK